MKFKTCSGSLQIYVRFIVIRKQGRICFKFLFFPGLESACLPPYSDVLLEEAHKQIFRVAENVYQVHKSYSLQYLHLLFDGRDMPLFILIIILVFLHLRPCRPVSSSNVPVPGGILCI